MVAEKNLSRSGTTQWIHLSYQHAATLAVVLQCQEYMERCITDNNMQNHNSTVLLAPLICDLNCIVTVTYQLPV